MAAMKTTPATMMPAKAPVESELLLTGAPLTGVAELNVANVGLVPVLFVGVLLTTALSAAPSMHSFYCVPIGWQNIAKGCKHVVSSVYPVCHSSATVHLDSHKEWQASNIFGS